MMAERDWRKANIYTPDPGAVIEVHDTGGIFCGNDRRPFVPKSAQRAKAAAKANRKRRKVQLRTAVPADTQLGLRLPLSKTHLIRSVMADLGRPMPSRIRPLNSALKRLIQQEVIAENGDFNLSHPLIRKWFAKIDSGDK